MVREFINVMKEKICKVNFQRWFVKYKFFLLALFLIIGVIFCSKYFFTKEKVKNYEPDVNLKAIFDETKPILINSKEKLGYISKDGELLLKPIYTFATDFFGEYAGVSTSEKKDKSYIIIDRSGNTIIELKTSKEPKYFVDYGIWLIDNSIYSKDLKILYEDNVTLEYIKHGFFLFLKNEKNESGIIDFTGKIVFSWKHDFINVSISDNQYEDGGYYAIVNDYEEEELLINLKNGRTLYKVVDPKVKYLREEKDNIFRLINREDGFKSEKWMYFKDNKLAFENTDNIYSMDVYDFDDDIIKIDYGKNYSDLNQKGRYSYYDIKKEKYLKDVPKEEKISWKLKKTYNYEIEYDKEKIGLKQNDRRILEPVYDKISFLDYKLHRYLFDFKDTEFVLYESEGKTNLYNIKKEKTQITFDSSSVVSNSDSPFLLITQFDENGYSKKNYLIYNIISNKSLEFPKDSDIFFGSNFITVSKDNKKSYYNGDLKEIYREDITVEK